VALCGALADSPRTILQTLAEQVLDVLGAESAGLSLLTKDGERFYWAAIAGEWRPHIGGGTPRDSGPCGDVLDRNVPMLFSHWERRYPYLSEATPLAEEGLLVPFYVEGESVGTIWAIAHNGLRKFDAEDLRLLESMGRFASAAYQVTEAIDGLSVEVAARSKAESELRDLTDDLESQVRLRTEELEQRHRQLADAQEKLRRSEALLAEGQGLSRTGTWRVVGDEITWSEQLYRIYEFEVGVPVTRDLIRTRVHPDDVTLLEKLKILEQTGDVRSDFEWHYRLVMPDGSIKYLHAIAHATRDQEGQVEYIAAVQDVTARRLSEEALEKARSELSKLSRVTSLGVLTASIAHEVNQPLSGIITNAGTCLRMLDADPPNVAGAQTTVRRTIRDGNRAADVVKRLRALFSNEELTLEMLDLNEVTREVIALSVSDLQRNRVALQTALAEDLPALTGDRIQLQQVILNLLRNASEAMVEVHGRPRQLVIRTEREDEDRVRMSVRDVGVGVDPESMSKLIDAFYTTKSGGMGLGLSVSRSIIERHHGRLWAEPNDGPGATFAFSIPTGQGIVPARHRDEERIPDERSVVSVVDDDESVRESLPDLLRQFGFVAEAFPSAGALLASEAVNHTSCLLLDVAMPGMSGPDLQQELTRRNQTIPIVFITANGDSTIRSRLLARGAVECLFKPLSEAALLDAIGSALRPR
jgi:C4-dicarboxylate-specific signal transduction histidine kinase/CheY-like chemotaxis protein